MRAQYIRFINIKCIVHCARWMIFGDIQRGKVIEIGLDFRTSRHPKTNGMKQLLQELQSGATMLSEVPAPRVAPRQLLVRTSRSLVSVGTERMLVDFGKAGLIGKALQQPDKVRQVFEKVRTDARAMQRLEELALDAATGSEVRIAVQHIGAPERARELAEVLRAQLPQAQIVDCPVGGVIGAHTGPGMVAVIIH